MSEMMQSHIEVVEGAGGPKARIAGSRIRVEDVAIWHEKVGMPVDEIVYHYPTITLADAYAALAYYWDHRDELERNMREGQAFVDEFRRTYTGPIEEKLDQRHA